MNITKSLYACKAVSNNSRLFSIIFKLKICSLHCFIGHEDYQKNCIFFSKKFHYHQIAAPNLGAIKAKSKLLQTIKSISFNFTSFLFFTSILHQKTIYRFLRGEEGRIINQKPLRQLRAENNEFYKLA